MSASVVYNRYTCFKNQFYRLSSKERFVFMTLQEVIDTLGVVSWAEFFMICLDPEAYDPKDRAIIEEAFKLFGEILEGQSIPEVTFSKRPGLVDKILFKCTLHAVEVLRFKHVEVDPLDRTIVRVLKCEDLLFETPEDLYGWALKTVNHTDDFELFRVACCLLQHATAFAVVYELQKVDDWVFLDNVLII